MKSQINFSLRTRLEHNRRQTLGESGNGLKECSKNALSVNAVGKHKSKKSIDKTEIQIKQKKNRMRI